MMPEDCLLPVGGDGPPLLRKGERMVIVGEAGVGTSTLCYQLAVAASQCRYPFHWRAQSGITLTDESRARRVVIVETEDRPGVVRDRLERLGQHYNAGTAPMVLCLRDSDLIRTTLGRIREPDLIVFPAPPAITDGDAHHVTEIRGYLDALRDLYPPAAAPALIVGNRAYKPPAVSEWIKWADVAYRLVAVPPGTWRLDWLRGRRDGDETWLGGPLMAGVYGWQWPFVSTDL